MVIRTHTNNNYFSCDLNQFIHENCSKEMTAIDIDTFMYKSKTGQMRLIESKHTNEVLPTSQYKALGVLSHYLMEYKNVHVYIITGDLPYNTVDIKIVQTNHIFRLKQKSFIHWLNFSTPISLRYKTKFDWINVGGDQKLIRSKLRLLHTFKL